MNLNTFDSISLEKIKFFSGGANFLRMHEPEDAKRIRKSFRTHNR